MSIVSIKNIKVYNVNMSSSDYITDAVQPSAYLGFASAIKSNIAKHLDTEIASLFNVSVLPIVHSQQTSVNKITHEHVKDDKNVGRAKNAELAEEALGTLHFSIIIDFGEYLDAENITLLIKRNLPTRFAGGVVSSMSLSGDFEDIEVEELTTVDASVLKKVQQGYVFSEATRQESVTVFDGNIDDFVGIIDTLSFRTPAHRAGWLIPIQIGYKVLSNIDEAKPKLGSRDITKKHVFAEPVISICELVSTRNSALRNADAETISKYFLSYEECEKDGFSYKTHSKYFNQLILEK